MGPMYLAAALALAPPSPTLLARNPSGDPRDLSPPALRPENGDLRPLPTLLRPLPELPRLADCLDTESLFEDPPEEILEDIFRFALALPNLLIEGTASLLLPDRLQVNGVTLFDQSPGEEDFAAVFARQFLRRERAFLERLAESGAVVTSARTGSLEIDSHRFSALQVRTLADVVKRTYRERFHVPPLDLDQAVEALSTGTWADTVLVPAGMSLYAARFGLDRRFHLGSDVLVTLQVDRASRIWRSLTRDAHHTIATASLRLFRSPLALLLAVDGDAGRLEVGFIGIGTDIGAVFDALAGAEAHRERER